MHSDSHGFAEVFVVIFTLVILTNNPPQRSDDSNIRSFGSRTHQNRIAHRERLVRLGSRSDRFGGLLLSIGPDDRFGRGSVSDQEWVELRLPWFEGFVWEKVGWLGETRVDWVRWPLVRLRG